MNPQETQQVIAHDEKWVPSAKRVKISPTNLRLETTVHQKEETFQVIIDVIKNSTCFKAFTISADVPEIFMQQFWYTIKKVKDLESYEFLLANKKCIVDAEVFRKILDIYPRVKGEEFTKVQDDDATLTFLIDLGYKGPLHKYTSIENVNYPELIWQDIAFQIDHRKEKRSRNKTMPFPRFTKVIINHFLSRHKSLSNLKYQHYHIIKDDGIVSRLKLVRIGEDYQEYGLPIPDMMLNDKIKQSKSYQMFIKYSTARKRTASRRVINKKVTIFAAANIIPDLDVALELGKSISLTEAAEEEAARQVYTNHTRIVTEPVPEPARRRPSDTMHALKESKRSNRRQPGTGGSSEGTGSIPGVPDESTVVSATLSEGTGTKPRVLDKEKATSEANVILEWGSELESEYSKEDQGDDKEVDRIYSEEDDEKKDDADDDKSINLEMTDDEETKYEFVQGEEQVKDDEDEKMSNAEFEESRNGDEENTDAAKADVEKTEEVKDDAKKAKLPLPSSSLSVSSGFGDQFLKLSSDTSLIGMVKDTTDAEINSLLDIKIQSEVLHI
ncbi:hypothetical protein Tco_0111042 [Tanacetum coccineum]